MKFAIGDRVAVYGGIPSGPDITWDLDGQRGTVVGLNSAYPSQMLCVKFDRPLPDGSTGLWSFHPKQCRKLVKKPRRRVWVHFLKFGTRVYHDTPQEGAVEFVEVKKKNGANPKE